MFLLLLLLLSLLIFGVLLYCNCFIRLFWPGGGHSGRNEEEKKGMQRSGQSRSTKLNFFKAWCPSHQFSLFVSWNMAFFGIVDRISTLEPNIHRIWGNKNWKMVERQNYWTSSHFIACVAGARKGKGEGKINWARAKRVGRGRGKRLQPAHCLFGLSRSPANEKSPLVRF